MPFSGSAATARRRASDSRGLSKISPKPNTIRSARAMAELNQSASSSGCATTTAVESQERVIKALESVRLPVDVELTLDQLPACNAHLVPPDGIVEQLCHPLGKRVRVPLRHQKPRAAVEDAFWYSAHSGSDDGQPCSRRFQQDHSQSFFASGAGADAWQHEHCGFAGPGKHIREGKGVVFFVVF